MINQIDHRKPCTDHLGNHFDSLGELASTYNMEPGTLSRRLNIYGWPMEKALTTPVKKNGGETCYDHTGKKFRSITKMCEHWKIQRKTYAFRRNQGMSIEEALTKPLRTKKELVES